MDKTTERLFRRLVSTNDWYSNNLCWQTISVTYLVENDYAEFNKGKTAIRWTGKIA